MSSGIKQVGVRKLRQDASGVLREVKAGASVEITEHGRPVARIIPIVASLWEDYFAAGLALPSAIEDWRPSKKRIRIKGGKTSTQILIEMRAQED
ncbi:MAG TPA: type II toxin-antitoxin system prevent-host-death family antitoxin [Candidatus Paceibacterota bacterium]|nr:type II toxin-antitoxin system prevent-host-death family antitoxin [Candidatus Paceibacterota bacterium]